MTVTTIWDGAVNDACPIQPLRHDYLFRMFEITWLRTRPAVLLQLAWTPGESHAMPHHHGCFCGGENRRSRGAIGTNAIAGLIAATIEQKPIIMSTADAFTFGSYRVSNPAMSPTMRAPSVRPPPPARSGA